MCSEISFCMNCYNESVDTKVKRSEKNYQRRCIGKDESRSFKVGLNDIVGYH